MGHPRGGFSKKKVKNPTSRRTSKETLMRVSIVGGMIFMDP
jgi:hypothetical protein